MKSKIEYDPDGFVVLNSIEWSWEHLKQTCFAEFVYEAKPRGSICHQYKVPRDILNEWIETEDWEIAKKSHWQRPFSYRIDSALAGLLQNIYHLKEIQKDVNDIPFEENEIENRVTITIDLKHKEGFIQHRKIVIEKYNILIKDEPDDFKHFEGHKEIRYKTIEYNESVHLKYKPVKEKAR
jgi:hypothetical protein